MMNNKKILCNWCNTYYDRLYVIKHKKAFMNYCLDCRRVAEAGLMPEDIRPIDHIEFNKNLKSLFNAPPLKLKDLKEQLKKEREEKNNKKKSGIKKTPSSFFIFGVKLYIIPKI